MLSLNLTGGLPIPDLNDYAFYVIRPALAEGARRAGRPVPPLLLQLVVAPSREAAATQMIAPTPSATPTRDSTDRRSTTGA